MRKEYTTTELEQLYLTYNNDKKLFYKDVVKPYFNDLLKEFFDTIILNNDFATTSWKVHAVKANHIVLRSLSGISYIESFFKVFNNNPVYQFCRKYFITRYTNYPINLYNIKTKEICIHSYRIVEAAIPIHLYQQTIDKYKMNVIDIKLVEKQVSTYTKTLSNVTKKIAALKTTFNLP